MRTREWVMGCMLAMGTTGCVGGHAAMAEGEKPAAASSELPATAAVPGGHCDATKDGWMPTHVPLPADLQKQLDAGTLLIVSGPPAARMQDRPPIGTPYCVSDQSSPTGGRWGVDCKTDGDCPAVARCSAFGQCFVTCKSDSDCDPPNTCEDNGIGLACRSPHPPPQ